MEHHDMFTYRSVAEVRAANRSAGGHFFDRDTMATFRTRVELRGRIIGGRYFITSDVLNPDVGPVYSVRVASESGDVRTAGNVAQHSGYRTLAEAEAVAHELVRADGRDERATALSCDDPDPEHIHDEDRCCECGEDHCCGSSACPVGA